MKLNNIKSKTTTIKFDFSEQLKQVKDLTLSEPAVNQTVSIKVPFHFEMPSPIG